MDLLNVRIAVLLFRRVAISLRLHSVLLCLHSVSLRLRSVVKLSMAFALNHTFIRLIARQWVFIHDFLQAPPLTLNSRTEMYGLYSIIH